MEDDATRAGIVLCRTRAAKERKKERERERERERGATVTHNQHTHSLTVTRTCVQSILAGGAGAHIQSATEALPAIQLDAIPQKLAELLKQGAVPVLAST